MYFFPTIVISSLGRVSVTSVFPYRIFYTKFSELPKKNFKIFEKIKKRRFFLSFDPFYDKFFIKKNFIQIFYKKNLRKKNI